VLRHCGRESKSTKEDRTVIRKWLDRVREKVTSSPAGTERPTEARDTAPGKPASRPADTFAADLAEATQEQPYLARLVERRLLTRLVEDYDEETIHLEMEIPKVPDPSLSPWQPGDALAVIPSNCPDEVSATLAGLGCTGEEEVDLPAGRGRVSLREALSRYCDIKNLTPEFVTMLLNASTAPEERERVATARADEAAYRDPRELQDLLRDFPSAVKALSPKQIIGMLGTIQPRLYSISSSPRTAPDRISLTVAVVRYELLGRPRTGLTTTYLADRVQINDRIPIFVQPNLWFHLPTEDEGKSCTMIGAGCGISAFRGFLQELDLRARAAGVSSPQEQSGGLPHLLFFGCRHEARDYLYEQELATWQSSGMVQVFNAFSRDQEYKIYVQHRMLEQGAMLWERMKDGHYFYVCGDAQTMAGDVEKAMRQIIQDHGGKSAEEADAYLIELGNEGRFNKDVWTA
jgi:sulfite reductase (NADPH) flavoprotein alpha-component